MTVQPLDRGERGDCRSRLSKVGAGECDEAVAPPEVVGREPSRADILQRADDVSDLMVQKGPCAEIKENKLAVPLDPDFIQRLNRGFGLAGGGAERRKIVFADEDLCRVLHFFDIKRLMHPPHPVDI